ncbi:MAG: nucleoside deaminase [Acidimicrobiia bacterium]|nr:nucleoside deaminase [Acidimicrobiia bacterium]
MTALGERDEAFLRRAIEVSQRSRANGNHPFGAIFVDRDGNVLLEAENSVVTSGDLTGHAETNLARQIGLNLSADEIAGGTFYSSCEPCSMCSGAVYWAGVNRLVFAMSETDLLPLAGGEGGGNPTMTGLGCRAVLASGQRRIEVSGPHLADEAVEAHRGFWDR